MSLTQLDYPVISIPDGFNNIFPSQKALNVNFNRLDVVITAIASGTGGAVEITTADNLDADLLVGDFVVWSTDSYSLRTSRIITVIDLVTIEVDEVFTTTDATNGFMNYRKGWFLEARFVASNTPTDQQGNVELVIGDFAQVPSALNGDIALDVSIVKDVLSPVFSMVTEKVESLSKLFKFQYRESYVGNRDALWISPNVAPANDTPIMLVLASKEVAFNDFTDNKIEQSKFVEKYPTVLSYVYSDINDAGFSLLTFTLRQYALNKTLLSELEIAQFNDISGVINIVIDPVQQHADAVFITVDVLSASNNGQYDGAQYDGAQYATA